MAENKHYYIEIVMNPNYKWNDNYKLTFLTPESFNILDNALFNLRKLGDGEERYFEVARFMFKHFLNNFYKIKELDYQQPRVIAQKFIGRKKIRDFIFNRDKNKCLKCDSLEKLTLDHIQAIHLGGENKLGNLQTLCKSCNSSKSTNFKDYRNGRI